MDRNAMLSGSVYRKFAQYVSLNIISMLGFSMYILADTFFIANGVGKDGLVALNLVLPVYSLLNALGLMLATGCGTFYAISLGKGETQEGNRMFTLICALAVVVGLLFTGLGVFFSVPLVKALGAEGDIIPLAAEYIRMLLIFSLAFLLNNLLVYMIRNDGSPRLAMTAMLAGCGFNTLFDYIFIFPMEMGMFGAALATGFSPIVGLLVNSSHFWRRKNHFSLVRIKSKFAASCKDLFRTVGVGGGAFITEFSSGIVIFLFNWAILGLVGEIGVAAYGIIANISLVFVAMFTGLGQGVQPLLSLYYGAGRKESVQKVLRLGLVVALTLGVVLYVLCFFFNESIANAFNKDGDLALLALTCRGIRLYFICIILMGVNILSTSFFASVAKPRAAFGISITRGFLAILPAVLILPRFLALDGVWLAIPLAEAVTCVLVVILLLRANKQQSVWTAAETQATVEKG